MNEHIKDQPQPRHITESEINYFQSELNYVIDSTVNMSISESLDTQSLPEVSPMIGDEPKRMLTGIQD